MKIYGPWPWDLSIYINYLEFSSWEIFSSLFIYSFIYQYGLPDIYFVLVIIQYYFAPLLKLFIFGHGNSFTWLLCPLTEWHEGGILLCLFGLVWKFPHFLSLYVPGSSCVFLVVFRVWAIIPRHSGYCYCKGCKKPRSGIRYTCYDEWSVVSLELFQLAKQRTIYAHITHAYTRIYEWWSICNESWLPTLCHPFTCLIPLYMYRTSELFIHTPCGMALSTRHRLLCVVPLALQILLFSKFT